jgi:TolA-binding protein
MLRFYRFLGTLVATSVIGFAALAHGQNAPEPQQGQAAPDTQGAAVQPAQDPDTANQIQQLQAAIDQLQQQVSRLTSAVEELQADRTESVKAAPAPPPRSKGKAPSAAKKAVAVSTPPAAVAPEADEKTSLTVLVFRDGHRSEASNYAIVGQTLWIYTEQDSKKVPLADLDVVATKNANADRGIVFQVPNTK